MKKEVKNKPKVDLVTNKSLLYPKVSPKMKKAAKDIVEECISRLTPKDAFDYVEWKLGLLATSVGISEGESGYQIKPALKEMIEKGVSRESIIDLVRVVQFDTLWDIFDSINGNVYHAENHNWNVFLTNENGEAIEKMPTEYLIQVFNKKENLWKPSKRKKSK